MLAAGLLGGAEAGADTVVTRWVLPPIQIPEAERPVSPSVFGTVALPVRAKPTSTRWAKLMRASLNQPALGRLTSAGHALAPEDNVAYVQVAVNHAIRTNPEITNCSDDGYWAPAQETLARGMGDCFDVAIAKMEALRLLGFPDRDLYLTTGWFGGGSAAGRGRESVALLVRVGERFWLLPEQSDHAYESTAEGEASRFTPVVTYGVGVTWVHGKVMPVSALAALTASAPVAGAASPAATVNAAR